MNKKREKWRKHQSKARKRAISEGPSPFYPETIDPKDFYDEIIITRHTPHGDEEIKIDLFMSPKRVGKFIAGILGRRGRFE
jgi:hypothetical protein